MGKTSIHQDHHQSILQAIDRGESIAQIADRLGSTKQGLRSYLKRRGIRAERPKQWRYIDIPKNRIQELLDSGLTQSQAADQLGVSLQTIEDRVARWGLRTARTGPRLADGHRFSWEGGRSRDKAGYVLVYAPLHPLAKSNSGAVQEHRLVMEAVLGRYLKKEEVVHHRDEVKTHNWPSNLQLFACNADHLRHHAAMLRERSTHPMSESYACGCTRTTYRCQAEHETLGQTPSGILHQLRRHIEIHRPTKEQQSLPFREVVRSGARLPPFE